MSAGNNLLQLLWASPSFVKTQGDVCQRASSSQGFPRSCATSPWGAQGMQQVPGTPFPAEPPGPSPRCLLPTTALDTSPCHLLEPAPFLKLLGAFLAARVWPHQTGAAERGVGQPGTSQLILGMGLGT